MFSLDTAVLVLAGITLLAAFVNGALGYGFSSLTVPVALVLHEPPPEPALVMIEVFINLYVLFINRQSVRGGVETGIPILVGCCLCRTRKPSSCARLTSRLDQVCDLCRSSSSHPRPWQPGCEGRFGRNGLSAFLSEWGLAFCIPSPPCPAALGDPVQQSRPRKKRVSAGLGLIARG